MIKTGDDSSRRQELNTCSGRLKESAMPSSFIRCGYSLTLRWSLFFTGGCLALARLKLTGGRLVLRTSWKSIWDIG